MKVSLNWLREFVDVPPDPRQLKTALTGVGLGVESFAPFDDDTVFEVEITTNRPDCLSHYGVARELAALYRRPLRRPQISVKEAGDPVGSAAAVEISEPQLCARYCARVVRNVQVRPSPAWLARRLESVGIRAINNVADVTNYVLMELGHPLHAFDLARLRQRKIIVRRARPGERLRTLDGVDRLLGPEHLVIADGERAVALAGVMGGEDSEISSATQAVLLESAWFEPTSIRRTARAHGLHTEASHRFERGTDVAMAPVALDRAAQLIAELADGEVLAGRLDEYPRPQPREPVVLRRSAIQRILGTEVPGDEVARILTALGFEVSGGLPDAWRVLPPTFRLDVAREVDLIEEIARQSGYDRLPARLRPAPPRLERDTRREKELLVSQILVSLGYREIITNSMIDPGENARFTRQPPVILANPLSQEASTLRSSAVPSLLRTLRWNLDRGQDDLRLFEIGKIYTAIPQAGSARPEERPVLTLGLSGYRRAAGPHDRPKPADFFDLKGDLETLLEAFDIPGLQFTAGDRCYHEKGWSGCFAAGETELATLGQIGSAVARDYKLRQTVCLAEVDLERLMSFPLRPRTFRPFSKFPAVRRDFSLLLPASVSYARLRAALAALRLPELQGFEPADVFQGGSLPPGTYSLLLRVTFQSDLQTLTGEQVEEASRRLLAALEPLGVRLRTPVNGEQPATG